MNRPEITGRISQRMHQAFPSVKLWLYGSEARGEARADSDIDLLVLVDRPYLSIADEMQLMAPLYDIELQTGVAINPVFMPEKEWGKKITPFYENVMQDRVSI